MLCAPPQQTTALTQAGELCLELCKHHWAALWVFLASLISQGRTSRGKHWMLTKSCNAWHHYRNTAIPFIYSAKKCPKWKISSHMPASVFRGSQTNYRLIPQCPGYQHCPKETARAHTELREGSGVPPYKDKGTALEYSKSEGDASEIYCLWWNAEWGNSAVIVSDLRFRTTQTRHQTSVSRSECACLTGRPIVMRVFNTFFLLF